MVTEAERIAKLEENKAHQEVFNATVCKTLDAIQKHLRKIELIAISALIVFGVERGMALLALLPK